MIMRVLSTMETRDSQYEAQKYCLQAFGAGDDAHATAQCDEPLHSVQVVSPVRPEALLDL